MEDRVRTIVRAAVVEYNETVQSSKGKRARTLINVACMTGFITTVGLIVTYATESFILFQVSLFFFFFGGGICVACLPGDGGWPIDQNPTIILDGVPFLRRWMQDPPSYEITVPYVDQVQFNPLIKDERACTIDMMKGVVGIAKVKIY